MGIVSHRLTRVTGEGTVYTIAPRFILPRNSGDIRKGDTTTFWLTLRVPQKIAAGDYQGQITLRFADGRTDTLPVHARLFVTPLDELDVPAGPWGSTLNLPWAGVETSDYNRGNVPQKPRQNARLWLHDLFRYPDPEHQRLE